jgi:hypothetical protein
MLTISCLKDAEDDAFVAAKLTICTQEENLGGTLNADLSYFFPSNDITNQLYINSEFLGPSVCLCDDGC